MFAAAMGWIGTVGTISAYVMLTRGLVNASSIRYGVLNLTGGLLGAAGSTAYGASVSYTHLTLPTKRIV